MIHPEKILLVDDERLMLLALQRQLRNEFDIHIAEGAEAGLKAMENDGPFAVVVSDMRMPGMSGAQFLDQVRHQWPESVRLMLTGNSDQATAVEAVNKGQIYRFLNKPCPKEILTLALDSALAQYRMVRLERDLLTETLNGSINLLSEVMAILSPLTFGRIAGIRRLTEQISKSLPSIDQWEVSAASMLAFIGCITLDETLLTRYFRGDWMEPAAQLAIDRHPEAGARLIARIPRLRGVAEIVRRQNQDFSATMEMGPSDDLGICANILKVAIASEWRTSNGKSHREIILEFQQRPLVYNPLVVKVLSEIVSLEQEIHEITIEQLMSGMILEEPLVSHRGDLLLAAGNIVSATMRERLLGIAESSMGIRQPFRVKTR